MAIGAGGGGGGASGVRAGGAFVEIGAKANLADFKAKMAQIGSVIASAAKFAVAAGGVGLAAGGGLFAAAIPTVQDLTKLDATAKALGITGEAASGLFGALGQYSDLGENIEGITQFSQKVKDAFDGIGEEPKKLFDGLSVSAADLIDLPLDEKFYRIHAAIRELPQDAQQFKLSMLGGTDSMKKWLPLLSISTEELRSQAAGFQLSQEQLDRASAAGKAYQAATAQIGHVWQEVVANLSPAIEAGATFIRQGVEGGRRMADTWDEAIANIEAGWQQLWIDLPGALERAIVQFGETMKRWWNVELPAIWESDNLLGPRLFFAELFEFFKDGWRSAVFVAQNLWNDFTTAVGKGFVDAMAVVEDKLHGVLDLLKNVPGVVGLGATAALIVGPNAGAVKAQLDRDNAAEAKRLQQELDKDRAAGRAELDDLKRRRDQAVRDAADRAAGLANPPAAPGPLAQALGKAQQAASGAFGVFRVGDFGRQIFADRTANPVVREQQKTNSKLDDMIDILDRAGPLVFG